jgi:PiT family inorganic phosphate transporter
LRFLICDCFQIQIANRNSQIANFPMLTLVLIIILVALLFDFFNGFNDAANSIATIVSTRVLSPMQAVAWAAFWNFVAAFAFGTAVASAISSKFVDVSALGSPTEQLFVILAGLIGATVWTYICSMLGLPISVSHSLISGFAGAAIAKAGIAGLVIPGKWVVTILFIFVSPMLGLLGGALLMTAVAWTFQRSTPSKVDLWFRQLQLASAAAFSLSHGTNDAQKTMGIIFIALTVLAGTGDYSAVEYWLQPGWAPPWIHWMGMSHSIPWWIILTCHFVIALGMLLGGWRVVRTMGHGITRLQPVGGFCAETAGAATVIGASIAGIPVSTTHCITGSIIGVGATRGLRAVRWSSGKRIVGAWIFTLPCSAFMAAVVYIAVHLLVEPFFR